MLHSPEHLERVLNTPMQKNDAGAATIREYFVRIAQEVWNRGEAFSGKRPFGDSSLEPDIWAALIKADLVTGMLDGEGCVLDVDGDAAEELIAHALKQL